MRIVILVDYFRQQRETFIRRHVAALRSDVVAVRMDPGDTDMMDWKPYVACLCPRKRADETPGRHILRRVREVLFGIPAPRWPKGMEELWNRYVAERRPDVALAEFAPNGMCAMEACERHRVPLVVHFLGYDASALMRLESYRRLLPFLFQRAAAVIVLSTCMRATLQRCGCDSAKLHVIASGAPVEEFTVNPRVADQPCRFLAVASMLPVKGPFHTLRAFRSCLEVCPEASLTMIGGGKLLPKAESWVRENSLGENVRLLGWQPVDVVRTYMRGSSVFVQHSVTTSLGQVEGWGVSIAEAASSGLPVVATRHGGIPDQVIDGTTGFLVREGDWEAMGEKMTMLARDPELRRQMGLAGRKNIEAVGNLTLQVEKLRRVLEIAAASGAAASRDLGPSGKAMLSQTAR